MLCTMRASKQHTCPHKRAVAPPGIKPDGQLLQNFDDARRDDARLNMCRQMSEWIRRVEK